MDDLFKVPKEKTCQPRKLSTKIVQDWRRVKDFPKQTKVEGVTTRSDLQEMLRGILEAEMKGCYLVT